MKTKITWISGNGTCLICGAEFYFRVKNGEPIKCPKCPEPKLYYDNLTLCEKEGGQK